MTLAVIGGAASVTIKDLEKRRKARKMIKIEGHEDFEILEIEETSIWGGVPHDKPYLYLLLRYKPTGDFHEVNLGCVGFDLVSNQNELKQRILDKIQEVIRECNG